MPASPQALIVGCGYLGTRIGRLLRTHGWTVAGTTTSPARTQEIAALGLEPVVLDVSQAWGSSLFARHHDAVVYAVAPGRGGDPRIAFHDGALRCAEGLLGSGLPLPRRFVFMSSTGVYPEQTGGAVDETSPADPTEERLGWLRKAERSLQDLAEERGLPLVVLRLAGLYGPGRSPLEWLRRPEMRGRIVASSGDAYMNWVRVEDAALAAVLAIEHGRRGEIYIVVDEEPVRRRDFYGHAARCAGLEVPEFVGAGDLGKRCSGRKAREELGFRPSFPTYRQGLEDLCGPTGRG